MTSMDIQKMTAGLVEKIKNDPALLSQFRENPAAVVEKLIPDYEKIEALARTYGAAFCLSGAGPTLLCITRDKGLSKKLAGKLPAITQHNWEILPLHVEFQGAQAFPEE